MDFGPSFDLLSLEKASPHLYQRFKEGYFAFQKTYSEFSHMGLDQVHDQINTMVAQNSHWMLKMNRVLLDGSSAYTS